MDLNKLSRETRELLLKQKVKSLESSLEDAEAVKVALLKRIAELEATVSRLEAKAKAEKDTAKMAANQPQKPSHANRHHQQQPSQQPFQNRERQPINKLQQQVQPRRSSQQSWQQQQVAQEQQILHQQMQPPLQEQQIRQQLMQQQQIQRQHMQQQHLQQQMQQQQMQLMQLQQLRLQRIKFLQQKESEDQQVQQKKSQKKQGKQPSQPNARRKLLQQQDSDEKLAAGRLKIPAVETATRRDECDDEDKSYLIDLTDDGEEETGDLGSTAKVPTSISISTSSEIVTEETEARAKKRSSATMLPAQILSSSRVTGDTETRAKKRNSAPASIPASSSRLQQRSDAEEFSPKKRRRISSDRCVPDDATDCGKISEGEVSSITMSSECQTTKETEAHKKAFDEIIEKYNFKSEKRSNEIAELLAKGIDHVSTGVFAERYGMDTQEAVIFLKEIKAGMSKKAAAATADAEMSPSVEEGADPNGFEYRWNEQFQKLKAYHSEHGHTRVPQKLAKLNKWIVYQRQRKKRNELPKTRVDCLNTLGFEWNLNSEWEERLQQLKAYKSEYGHIRVPVTAVALRGWMDIQRERKKYNRISKSQIDRLDAIGFEWTTSKKSDWMSFFDRLEDYKARHNHCNVSFSDRSLGEWALTQRLKFKEGLLEYDKVDLLKSIGFQFTFTSQLFSEWMQMVDRFRDHEKEHGTTEVCDKSSELGIWIAMQRFLKKHNALEPKRIGLLESIGFDWTQSQDENEHWMAMYARLVDYKNKHHTCRVPIRYKADAELGNWVEMQRQNCKIQRRVDLLNQIGFVWDSKNPTSKSPPNLVKKFRSERGEKPQNIPEGMDKTSTKLPT